MIVSLTEWSARFLKAEKTGIGISAPTNEIPDLNVEDAYQIQLETIRSKIQSGLEVSGKKIGLTSKAMQQVLGVNEPDYGHLLNGMEVQNNGYIPRCRLIQPKVEAEVAFILKKDLHGPNITVDDVIEATDYVVASIEVVDSRVMDWKIKLQDTVADNASSGLYILGDRKIHLSEIDLPSIQMSLYKNGEFMNQGTGDAVLGNPATCVAWLVNKLNGFKGSLNAGEVILSGALSAAIEAKPGDRFSADFGDKLGKVSVNFE
ncbi:2-keto-4-pentenoate hydratase [Peribacillus simplex]|uniref:2-keto-4-pentenoate hydratase n=1 Tax=Peribacillus simplex TaxID=1478 RepID=A0AAW7ICR0_9BACI|nr:2-keto-4-pentenoate hydratase [Peribacillus simplex]AMM92900.1 2-keto-4-pentenoate hydratase [Peribacillus simplex]MDM5294950.1 2-keto-4-pentenoate hydratase [Peribacillus simplex]MDM5453910.1 2-keto-4-pentenoate hydratase [Peribacillus simplex]